MPGIRQERWKSGASAAPPYVGDTERDRKLMWLPDKDLNLD